MCQSSAQFKFCSCLQADAHYKPEYRWELFRPAPENDWMMIGEMRPPVTDLGETVTTQNICAALNKGNCFDFSYTPEDGDQLSVSSEKSGDYLFFQLSYEDSCWVEHSLPDRRTPDDKEMGKGYIIVEKPEKGGDENK